jgi:threonine/homoserine/homoserine lactone efflux protein
MACVLVAILVGAAAILLLVLRLFVVAAVVAGAFVVFTALATLLLRRADPEELEERSRASQRWLDAWARGMAQASGAWNPRHRAGERNRKRP